MECKKRSSSVISPTSTSLPSIGSSSTSTASSTTYTVRLSLSASNMRSSLCSSLSPLSLLHSFSSLSCFVSTSLSTPLSSSSSPVTSTSSPLLSMSNFTPALFSISTPLLFTCKGRSTEVAAVGCAGGWGASGMARALLSFCVSVGVRTTSTSALLLAVGLTASSSSRLELALSSFLPHGQRLVSVPTQPAISPSSRLAAALCFSSSSSIFLLLSSSSFSFFSLSSFLLLLISSLLISILSSSSFLFCLFCSSLRFSSSSLHFFSISSLFFRFIPSILSTSRLFLSFIALSVAVSPLFFSPSPSFSPFLPTSCPLGEVGEGAETPVCPFPSPSPPLFSPCLCSNEGETEGEAEVLSSPAADFIAGVGDEGDAEVVVAVEAVGEFVPEEEVGAEVEEGVEEAEVDG
mmetsp:Transcript_19021/g.48582  ORF Transcript_19021/g.48582 Transcript_19021/m.48582 type:complete len:405 (+) Transcript_19021:1365-2579(+)